MHIGLIGGIGPAAQDYYCRRLIRSFVDAGAPLEMTIAHADTPTLLANLAGDRAVEQAEIFAALTERLARAGAAFVAVTSIAGHFCRREFAARACLPAIDLIEAVARDVERRGLRRIGVLGTRTVMQSQFYGGLPTATVIAPTAPMLDDVHAAYVAMAIAGAITPEQRAIFHRAADSMTRNDGAEAILLGGTDLALAFDAATSPFALVDCAAIHVEAIVAHAMGGEAAD